MKIQEAIDWADEMKPNAFTSEAKLAWLNALEGRIAADVFLMAPAEIAALRYTEEDMEPIDPADLSDLPGESEGEDTEADEEEHSL